MYLLSIFINIISKPAHMYKAFFTLFCLAFPNLYAIRGCMHRDTLQVQLESFREINQNKHL